MVVFKCIYPRVCCASSCNNGDKILKTPRLQFMWTPQQHQWKASKCDVRTTSGNVEYKTPFDESAASRSHGSHSSIIIVVIVRTRRQLPLVCIKRQKLLWLSPAPWPLIGPPPGFHLHFLLSPPRAAAASSSNVEGRTRGATKKHRAAELRGRGEYLGFIMI